MAYGDQSVADIDIIERIDTILTLIRQTEASCRRETGSVQLLAVSKGHSASMIKQAFTAGLRDFGESYLQEAQSKLDLLSTLPICWHFIGPVQSNKTQAIAQNFSWVHGVSRFKIAQRLNDARPISMPPLNICLQVNFDEEASKSGIDPAGVEALASAVLRLPRLHLRGLMMIPRKNVDEALQYLSFVRLTNLLNTLNHNLSLTLDTLSMGMSDDWQAAIRAGSTMIRIGSAIFGERQ